MMNKILVLFVAVLLLCGVGLVQAYDADTPYTNTVKWIIPSDTTFTVTLAGGESTIDFDTGVTGQTVDLVEPDSQVAASNTPIINISNDGNLALNFTCNLTAAKPSWATIKVGNTSTHGDATEFDTTAQLVEKNIAAGTYSDMYLWTNLTSATQGTTERTLQINSEIYT